MEERGGSCFGETSSLSLESQSSWTTQDGQRLNHTERCDRRKVDGTVKRKNSLGAHNKHDFFSVSPVSVVRVINAGWVQPEVTVPGFGSWFDCTVSALVWLLVLASLPAYLIFLPHPQRLALISTVKFQQEFWWQQTTSKPYQDWMRE